MTDRLRIILWFVGVVVIFLGGYLYARYASTRCNLFAPVDILEKPGVLTGAKLALTGGEACFAALDRGGIKYTRLPDQTRDGRCHFRNVVRLDQSLVQWNGEVTLTCPMMLRLAIWERHALVAGAKRYLDADVISVTHYGTYSCRNINNAASGQLSQHGLANAIDIASFQLADGREIAVSRHWRGQKQERQFLNSIHSEACGYFATVLGPDYNALHEDHFHFDHGGFSTCR